MCETLNLIVNVGLYFVVNVMRGTAALAKAYSLTVTMVQVETHHSGLIAKLALYYYLRDHIPV